MSEWEKNALVQTLHAACGVSWFLCVGVRHHGRLCNLSIMLMTQGESDCHVCWWCDFCQKGETLLRKVDRGMQSVKNNSRGWQPWQAISIPWNAWWTQRPHNNYISWDSRGRKKFFLLLCTRKWKQPGTMWAALERLGVWDSSPHWKTEELLLIKHKRDYSGPLSSAYPLAAA